MDSIWIYIIIAVVYGVLKLFKKAANPGDAGAPPPDRGDARPSTTQRPRQLTFEELLKEITEAKQEAKPAPQPQRPTYESTERTPTYVDYDDDIQEEEKSLEQVDYEYRKKDTAYERYTEAKRIALESPSLGETLRSQSKDVEYGKFKEFEVKKETRLLDTYLKDLQDPDGWKKAVVMSEILNRRFQYW